MFSKKHRNELWQLLDERGAMNLHDRENYRWTPGTGTVARANTTFFDELWGLMYHEGQHLLHHREEVLRDIDIKVDGDYRSPVLEQGDLRIDAKLKKLLRDYTGLPIVSEESSPQENARAIGHDSYVWVIDPIDGTRSYIEGRDEYTINVALLSPPDAKGNRAPVFGAVYVPAKNELYFTDEKDRAVKTSIRPSDKGFGAALNEWVPLRPKQSYHGKLDVACGSRDLADGVCSLFVKNARKVTPQPDIHTGTYRSMLVADGRKHAAIFTNDHAIWDVAAADAILRRVNGRILPVDADRHKVIAQGVYYGADEAQYKGGKLFQCNPYISGNTQVICALGIESDVRIFPDMSAVR